MPIDKSYPSASAVIFFDFDHVLHQPDLINDNDPESYACEKNGFLGGTIIASEALKQQVIFAKENNIALYVLTERPDNELHRLHIRYCLQQINGFHEGPGGFKENQIICLGIESYCPEKQRREVKILLQSKACTIKNIHRLRHPDLPRSHLLFVDDDPDNLDLVTNAGYSTKLALKLDATHEHLRHSYHFMQSIHQLSFVTTLGHDAIVLTDKTLKNTAEFGRSEHIIPIEEETEPHYWRASTRPDYAALTVKIMQNKQNAHDIEQRLAILGDPHQLFFTQNEKLIETYLLKYTDSDILSLEDLAQKKTIILLGSTGKRKLEPLKNTLKHFRQNSEKIAIIGLPAESGVNLQPIGHEETKLGAQNRLAQLNFFSKTLKNVLQKHTYSNPPTIACLAIESGMGLIPVENIDEQGNMHMADGPLYNEHTQHYHFYDQTHIILSINDKEIHDVTRPACVPYTLMSPNKTTLTSLFEKDKPTYKYYQQQSQWSKEMLKKIARHDHDV